MLSLCIQYYSIDRLSSQTELKASTWSFVKEMTEWPDDLLIRDQCRKAIRSEHITDALISLHWLRVPEHIRYLGPLDRVVDLPGRRALHSASFSRLVVPTFRLSTVGSRSFNVSAPRIWNGLPEDVASAPSLSTFRRRLKTYLFQQSYPDVVVH